MPTTERTVLVRLKANTGDFVRGFSTATAAVAGLRHEIDSSNQSAAWMAQSILALGPTIAPLGAAAVPILSGLATQLTLTAGAAGVAVAAFSGVGDAMDAVNKYQLDPTTANFKKMQQELSQLGEDGERFVYYLQSVEDEFRSIQRVSSAGVLPGATQGIEEALAILPQVRRIVAEIAAAEGQLFADAGAGLAGSGFAAFFDYLEAEARPILLEMGRTLGNFAVGVANLLVALSPLTRSFSDGFEEMSASFADWAVGLAANESFQGFVDYVQQSTPKALDLLGSLADAFVALLKAAAPVGDVMLPILSRLLDMFALFIDTPVGTAFIGVAAAVGLMGRAMALAQITTGGVFSKLGEFSPTLKGLSEGFKTLGADIREALRPPPSNALRLEGAAGFEAFQTAATARKEAVARLQETATHAARAGAALGLMGVAASGAADKVGLSNTVMLAAAGSVFPGYGTAIGAAIGLLLDLGAAHSRAKEEVSALADTLDRGTGAATELTRSKLFDQFNTEAMTGALDRAGISMRELIDATIEGGSALEGLQSRLESVDQVRGSVKGGGGNSPGSPLSDQVGSVRENFLSASEQAEAYRESVLLSGEASADTASEVGSLDAGLRSAADSAEQFDSAMSGLNETLSRVGAASAYEDALDRLKESLKESKSFDDNLEKGRANLANLSDVAETAAENFRVLAEQGREVAARNVLKRAIDDLRSFAGETREGKKLTRELIEGLKELDSVSVEPRVHVDDRATRRLRDIYQQMKQLDGQTATTEVIMRYSRNIGSGEDIFRTYAHGDIANAHSPHIAKAGTYRVFAEAETGGEAYIPLANDWRRPRAESILAEVAQRFGWQIHRFASGGFRAAGPLATGGGSAGFADFDRLAAVLAAARPLIGSMELRPHSYGEVAAEFEQLGRLATYDGRRR